MNLVHIEKSRKGSIELLDDVVVGWAAVFGIIVNGVHRNLSAVPNGILQEVRA